MVFPCAPWTRRPPLSWRFSRIVHPPVPRTPGGGPQASRVRGGAAFGPPEQGQRPGTRSPTTSSRGCPERGAAFGTSVDRDTIASTRSRRICCQACSSGSCRPGMLCNRSDPKIGFGNTTVRNIRRFTRCSKVGGSRPCSRQSRLRVSGEDTVACRQRSSPSRLISGGVAPRDVRSDPGRMSPRLESGLELAQPRALVSRRYLPRRLRCCWQRSLERETRESLQPRA